jgi:uncharacterized protein YggE
MKILTHFIPICLVYLLTGINCFAQTGSFPTKKSKTIRDENLLKQEDKSSIRFIIVTGLAEKEVTPDIIYLNLTLKEYFLDKDGKNKIFIEDLEKNFQRTVIDNGIPNENINIEAISGFAKLNQRKKNESFLASKSYKIKLSDLDKINIILEKLDPKALTGVYISGYDFSQIEQTKKELRIAAMVNAKIKAAYCLTAVDESLGSLLETEIDESSLNEPIRYSPITRMASQTNMDSNSTPDLIDFKKIKLNASVRLKFQIR